MTAAIREEVRTLDPDRPLFAIRTLDGARASIAMRFAAVSARCRLRAGAARPVSIQCTLPGASFRSRVAASASAGKRQCLLGKVDEARPLKYLGDVTATDPRIRFVLALMERHRATPLSIDELARAVNLSPAHLRRLFQRELGCSPARMSRELRLDHARHLLQTSFLTVKEVMAATGWNDPSHFSREFKRRHGQAPRALRGTLDDLMVDPVVADDTRR